MLKLIKVGGLLVTTGVFVGLGVVGVLYARRGDSAPLPTKPGSVVLDTATPPAAAATLLAEASRTGSTGASQTAALSATPSADDLSHYQKYSNENTAMYGDITVGQGAAVTAGSLVTVNYRGWLTNGKVFDESYSSGHTFSFKEGENKVIPGWEEGLYGMKAGGKRRLIVPPLKGYGSIEHNGIPGGSVLVFDIELVSVQ